MGDYGAGPEYLQIIGPNATSNFQLGCEGDSGYRCSNIVLQGVDIAFNGNTSISAGNKLSSNEICLGGDCRTVWESVSLVGLYNNVTSAQNAIVGLQNGASATNTSLSSINSTAQSALTTANSAVTVNNAQYTNITSLQTSVGQLAANITSVNNTAIKTYSSILNQNLNTTNSPQFAGLAVNNATGHNLTFFSNTTCAGFRNPATGAVLCLG